jgi:hypothetical protein
MAIDKGLALRYYKKKVVQEELVKHAEDKEIGTQYNGAFGKRPDILVYPNDIIELAKQGMSSLHCSEELWYDPLQLNSNFSRKELDKLRKGWDLILDIDCAILEYSKICGNLIIKFLKYCGVKDISCKFSGNKGFHIAVPFEAFPSKVGELETKNLFPEAPRKIAFYIKENIKEELGKRIMALEGGDINKIKEQVGLEIEKLVRYERNKFGDQVTKLNVDNFLEIDTVLIASRHLYRMPYSLHEKSGLASLPINPDDVMQFEKPIADPGKFITPLASFLDRGSIVEGSARNLLVQALDFQTKTPDQMVAQDLKEELERKRLGEEIKVESPITEEFYPPCIKTMLNGLEDGRKRAVFVLMNFLGQVGWEKKEIQSFLLKWNREKNVKSLRENYILSQLRYFKAGEKLPPNCNNEAYYHATALCKADPMCAKFKNPANYTLVKWKRSYESRERDRKMEERSNKKENKERNESNKNDNFGKNEREISNVKAKNKENVTDYDSKTKANVSDETN